MVFLKSGQSPAARLVAAGYAAWTAARPAAAGHTTAGPTTSVPLEGSGIMNYSKSYMPVALFLHSQLCLN